MLVFGLIENYWLFDFGLRSATVKYAAQYRATGEIDKLNSVINTGVVYFSFVAASLMGGTVILARYVHRLFQVSPALVHDFQVLVVVIGASWAFGMIFNIFNATLEGFQRFDISSRIWISVTAIRVFGTALLLYLGYGLIAIGVLVVGAQVTGYAMSLLSVRRVFPAQRFSLQLAKWSTLKGLLSYGIHTLTGTIAQQLLNQSAPLLIGHFRPAAQVGYYNVPVRLLQYTGDAVSRVALVTTSNSSELQAKGEEEAIPRLGMYVNRYCFALFVPVGIFLLVYGAQLIRVWIRDPRYVAASAPLIPVLLIGALVALAGQTNSSAILYGIARHKNYARGLLAEGLLLAAGLYFVVPRYGILGAAWVSTLLMLLVRGVYTPWLVCAALGFSFARYMGSIYVRPLLTAAPVTAFAYWMKAAAVPGATLIEVLGAAAAIAALYYALSFVTTLERRHRATLLEMVARRLRPAARVQAA